MAEPIFDTTGFKRLPEKAFLFHISDKADSPAADGLLNGGIAGLIQTKYENAVSRVAWGGYDGMWRAASSGIARGMIVATTLAVAAAGLIGMFLGHASSGVAVSLGQGALNGVVALSGSLPVMAAVLSIGAAAGAIYEVSNHRDDIQAELAKTRQMMRAFNSESKDKAIGVEKAHELAAENGQQLPMRDAAVAHDFDATGMVGEHASTKWQDLMDSEQARINADRQRDNDSRGR